RPVAMAAADPRLMALAEEFRSRFPLDRPDARGAAHVVRTGETEFFPEITAAAIAAAMPDPEARRLLLELGLSGSLVVPVFARGKAIGAISLAMSGPSRQLTRADVAMAQELGRRAGMAIDNAALYRAAREA